MGFNAQLLLLYTHVRALDLANLAKPLRNFYYEGVFFFSYKPICLYEYGKLDENNLLNLNLNLDFGQ